MLQALPSDKLEIDVVTVNVAANESDARRGNQT